MPRHSGLAAIIIATFVASAGAAWGQTAVPQPKAPSTPAVAKPTAPARPTVPATGVRAPGGKAGVSQLTSSDCRNVGGKVVTVSDNRCGPSKTYCRMPDTNAVCIEEAAR
jgi:putative hemolysin